MKKSICLSDQDLTLLHYGETPVDMALATAGRHLTDCAACRARQQDLERSLARLPKLEREFGSHHATRMAARVTDRLARRRSPLPALATVLTAAVVVFVVGIWTPQPQVLHNSSTQQQAAVQQETPPEVDLLENLELLKELDTLSEIAGV